MFIKYNDVLFLLYVSKKLICHLFSGSKEFSCSACDSKHPTKASLMLHMSHSCKAVNNDTINDNSTSIT